MTTSDWSLGTNWSAGTVPTGTATFATTGVGAITVPSATSIDTIKINSNSYSFDLSGTLKLNSATGGIIDNSAGTISFSNGTIAGSGGISLGSGTLILNAAGTYTGPTTVDTGTLQVDGSIASAVAVSSGLNPAGTLSGTGAVGATTISHGTLAPGTPGNPTGTLTVNGNLALSSDAGYVLNVNGTNASTTNVNGAATLSGILTAVAAPGSAASYSAADTYTILNASGGVSLNFWGLGISGSFGNLVPYLAYNTNGANNNVVMGLTAGTAWLGATPTSGEYLWSTTTNWAGGIVPAAIPASTAFTATAGPASTVATFGGTPPPAATPVAINSLATANALLIASSATAPFPFAINDGGLLVLAGTGIVNNSAYAPQFTVGGSAGSGTLELEIAATASNAAITNNDGGSTIFGILNDVDTVTAGTASIINNNGGSTTFYADSTAGSATITTYSGGATAFYNNSTAGAATIVTNNGGTTTFYNYSTGGNAVFITNTGGVVDFGSSDGPLSNPDNVSAGAIEETDGGTGGEIELSSNTLTITAGVPATSFAGVISGSGGLTIAGGTTTLTGTNTYTGATAIDGGTLAVSGSAGSIATSSGVAVNSGGTLSGSGTVPAVTVASGGTLAPGAPTGTLTINGNLTLDSGADYAATIDGGSNSTAAVTGTANKATLNGTFTAIAGGGTYSPTAYTVLTTANATGVSGTFSGLTVSGNFGNEVPYLIYNANNVEVELTAGNVWTGGSGNWSTGPWSGGSAPTSALTLTTSTATFNGAGATVTVDTAATAANMLFTSTATGPYIFDINNGKSLALSGIGIINNSTNTQTFCVGGAAGTCAGGSGTGTLQFQNAASVANNSTGGVAIDVGNGGTTTFSGNSTGGTAQFTTAAGGVVNFSGTTGPSGTGNVTAGAVEGNGEIILGSNTLTVSAPTGTFSGALGAVGDTGGFTVGAGTQVLSDATGNYTGATTIDSGANLTLESNASISNSNVVVDNGTFNIAGNGATSIASLAGTNTGASVVLGANTLTITSGASTFSGAIGGSGGLTVAGGVQTLAGVNSYTGATTIEAGGTLFLTGTNSIAASSPVTIGAGGTLGLGENVQTINSIDLNGGTVEGGLLNGTINSNGGSIIGVGGSASVCANPTCPTTGSAGITLLGGTNTYTGTTTINAGATVAAANANAFSPNSAVTINGGGTLDLGSNNQTIFSLAGSGTVTNASAQTGLSGSVSPVLTIDGNAFTSTTFSGGITNGSATGVTDTTGLTLAGGTLVLNAPTTANTYTGATTVNGGTLSVDTNITSSSGVTVNSGGALAGTGTVPAVTVNAGGTLAPGTVNPSPPTVGTLNVAGSLTLAGDYAVTIDGGSSSETIVTGSGNTASLGGIFTAVPTGGSYSASYTVLAAPSVSGTFSGITINNTYGSFGDQVPVLSYSGTNVDLTFTGGTVWTGSAASSDWNTGGTANWGGSAVPGSTGVAAFDTTTHTTVTVTVSTPTQIGTMLFYTGADPFTFNINSSLALNGIGIVDNSTTQNFSVNGTLQFQNAATAGDATVTITTNSGGLTQFTGNSTGGTAQFTTTGTGVVDFSGSLGPNSDGNITAGSIAGTGNYYLGSIQLTITGSQSTTVGPATVGGVGGVISDCGTGSQCIGNANGTTGGSLVMDGTGTLTLSGANTYTGGTTLSAGTVQVGVNSVFTTSGVPSSGIVSSAIGTGTLTFNGGTLQAGDTNFSTDKIGFTIANAAQITNLGGTIDANGQIFTLAGAIANDPASTTIGALKIESSTGTGTVIFTGANTYSGATTISSGATLEGGAANTFSPNSAMTVSTGATLDLGSQNQTVGALIGSGTVTNLTNPAPVATPATATLIVNNGGSFSGTIANGSVAGVTTALTVAGGTLTLSSANASYSGATTINSGATLTLNGTSIQTSTGVINNGTPTGVINNGTFNIGGNAPADNTIVALSGTNPAANVVLGAKMLTISNGSTAYPYYGAITGTGGLTVGAGGAVALFGTSTYSGATTIASGATLQVGANGALGSSTVTIEGGTLQAGANNLTLNNGVTLTTATDTFDSHGNTLTWTGAITGGAGADLTVIDSVGGGTLVLAGANTYTGPTNVNSGNLQVNGSIAGPGIVTVNSGATLSGTGTVPGVTVATGGTLSPGTASNLTGTLTINGNLAFSAGSDYAVTLNGSSNSETIVSGDASLTGATLTIGGTATSTSATILTAASRSSTQFSAVNITGSFGDSLPNVTYPTAGTVVLNMIAGNVWQGSTAAGGNVWSPTTGSNWTTGNPPTSAGSDVNTSVAAFDTALDTSKVTNITISGANPVGTVLFNSQNTTAFTFTIASGSSLTLDGDGVVNESTTTAPPTFNVSGEMLFTDNSSGGNAQYNVASGGVLDFSGSSGNSQLSAGSITGAGNIYLGSSQLAVGNNNLSPAAFSGVIADGSASGGTGGAINKVGIGTLILSGANTYTGGTTVTAGILNVVSNTNYNTANVPSSGILNSAIGTGTLTLNGGTFQAGANNLTFANSVALGNAGGTIDTKSYTMTLSPHQLQWEWPCSWAGLMGITQPSATSQTASSNWMVV